MLDAAYQEIGAGGYEEASMAEDGDDNAKGLLGAICRLQARVCIYPLEVLSLLDGDFPKAAHIICRSIHEGAVVASVFAEHGLAAAHSNIGLRFLLFDHISKLMDAKEYQ